MCVIKETATDKNVFIVSHAFLTPVYTLYTLLKVVALQIKIYFKGIFNLYNVIFLILSILFMFARLMLFTF